MVGVLHQVVAAHQRAVSHSDHNRFDLAYRWLRRALDLLGGIADDGSPEATAARIRVLTSLARAEEELHGDGGAELREARRLAESLGDPVLLFTVVNQSGLLSLRRGRYADALTDFARAELLVGHATQREACNLYLNRGNLRLERLELAAARRDLQACIDRARPDPDRGVDGDADALMMAKHNLGYLEYLRGNLPLALRLMDEAAPLATGISSATGLLDKARVLVEAGLTDEADRALVAAAEEFRRGRLYYELAETELARAECAALRDRLAEARALAGQARTHFRRRGNDRWRRMAELTLLLADQAAGRPPLRLVGPATRLAEEFAGQGLALQSRTAALIGCSALTAAGQPERARAWFATLAPISRSDPIGIKLHQRAVAAELSLRQGQRSGARSQVRQGLNELSRHQAQFGSLDLQTAGAVHGRQLVRLDLRLALASQRPAAVFNAIERGRAASRRLTAVTPPADESAEALTELRLVTEGLRTVGDDPAMRKAAVAMRQRSSALFGQLRSISWRAVGAGAVLHPAAMAPVAEAVRRAGKVLVSYCLFEDRWSAVVLGLDRPRLVALPGDGRTVELARRAKADLDVLALGAVPAELHRAAEHSLRRALTELDDRLVRPLRLGDRAVVVVPTGATSTLPWGCLPSLRGRPVEVSPTATSWLAGALAVDTVGPVSVQALAGPGLSSAAAEVADVAGCWGTGSAVEHLSGPDARRARLAEGLASATVLHVAAHGSHNQQNPLFSSLELTDGAFFAYEIGDAEVPPHVVLSACELGQSTNRPGDEALGWTRVLLQLGSQCVVAGISQVADDRAREVMVDYHRRLAAGADSATALAAATEHGPCVPFVCFGSSWRAVPTTPGRPRPTAPSAEGRAPTDEAVLVG